MNQEMYGGEHVRKWQLISAENKMSCVQHLTQPGMKRTGAIVNMASFIIFNFFHGPESLKIIWRQQT